MKCKQLTVMAGMLALLCGSAWALKPGGRGTGVQGHRLER